MGVVRQGKAFYCQIAKLESRAGVENPPFRFVFQFRLDGSGGHQIGVDFRIEFLGESGNARRMIAVFMGDEDGVYLFRTHASLFQHAAEPSATEARVHQNATILGDKQATVARAAATEDRELHGHRKDNEEEGRSNSNRKLAEGRFVKRFAGVTASACVFLAALSSCGLQKSNGLVAFRFLLNATKR